jgi:hypothetical protein
VQFVVPICLLVGCWEKIEYQGTFGTPTTPDTEPSPPVAVNDVPGEQPQPAPTVGERYTAKADGDATSSLDAGVESPLPETPAAETPTPDVTETDPPAMPVSATVETDSPLAATSTKQAAWILGSRLSLAALANDRGVAPEDVPKWFDEARAMAERLNVSLADLPERPSPPSETPTREVLGFILNEEKTIAAKLATDHGDEHDAIFRLAIRTNLLRVLNTPGSKAVATLSTSISDLGSRSMLPIELWQPLLDLLNNGATSAAIRAAVPEMHQRIDLHLAAEQ